MKKSILLVMLVTCSFELLPAQDYYFKPNLKYHLSLSKEPAPDFFTTPMPISGLLLAIPAYISEFSLANGFSFGGITGYKINDFLSLELGIDYFGNKESIVADKAFGLSLPVLTKWNLTTLNSIPTFVIGKNYGKSHFSAKAGLIIGLTSLKKTVTLDDHNTTFKMKASISKGYMFGFEYSTGFSRSLSLVAGCGVEELFYTPRRAVLIENEFSNRTIDETYVYLKEIKYVKKIDNRIGSYDRYTNTYFESVDKPSVRLSETLILNSMYIEIGLIYKFKLNGKI
jgi:hypothetical protein